MRRQKSGVAVQGPALVPELEEVGLEGERKRVNPS
jgi:hypothetical protein